VSDDYGVSVGARVRVEVYNGAKVGVYVRIGT